MKQYKEYDFDAARFVKYIDSLTAQEPPAYLPDEFNVFEKENGYAETMKYVRKQATKANRKLAKGFIEQEIPLRGVSRMFRTEVSSMTKKLSAALTQEITSALQIQDIVRMSQRTGFNIHYLYIGRQETAPLIHKYELVIEYLAEKTPARIKALATQIKKSNGYAAANYDILITEEQEVSIIERRMREYCENRSLPKRMLINNSRIRSRLPYLMQNAEGNTVITGGILTLMLICLTTDGITLDYLMLPDYSEYLPKKIINGDKEYKITQPIRQFLSFLMNIDTLENENRTIGHLLAGEYEN